MNQNSSKYNKIIASVLLGLKSLKDITLHGYCVCCGAGTAGDEKYICTACKRKIRKYGGKRLIFHDKAGVNSVYFLFPYDKWLGVDLGNAVRVMKYEGHWKLSNEFSELLSGLFYDYPVLTKADCITYIPLHPARFRERGFNQSGLLAKGLSAHTGIPCRPLLKRMKNTPRQMELSSRERELNVKGAFTVVSEKSVKDKGVLIVDDQITTGATLNNAGETLLKSGAAWVICLTLTH